MTCTLQALLQLQSDNLELLPLHQIVVLHFSQFLAEGEDRALYIRLALRFSTLPDTSHLCGHRLPLELTETLVGQCEGRFRSLHLQLVETTLLFLSSLQ